MRELVAADVPFVREEVSRAEALERFADQPYKVEIIQGLDDDAVEGEVGGGDSVTLYRNGDWADLCLRPARALDRPAGRVPADQRGRRVLARRRAAPDADQRIYGTAWATDAGPRRVPDAAGRGREARPSQARAAARPVLLARRARAGAVDLAPARRDLPQAARGLRARPPPRARLRPGRDAAHRAVGALGDLRAPGEVRGQHVSADADGHGRLLREAHELPVPRPGLQVAGALVPRSADATVRAGDDLPPRAPGRAARAAPHPRRDAGRLAHHLHARSADRRDPARCSS